MPDASCHVLAVIPHPDDESYSMAATLHGAARAGATVEVLCATRGERGEDFSAPPAAGPGELAVRRSAELAASCALLGAQPPRFLDLADGGLAALPAGRLEAALVDAMSAVVPRLVLALGADGAYGHADHLALSDALAQAVAWLNPAPRLLHAAFPSRLFLPQWRRMTGGPSADLVVGDPPSLGVDAGGVDLRVDVGLAREVKRASIGAHRSQLRDGTPESLFPEGIVEALLAEEWFTLASGPALPPTATDPLAGLDS